MPFLFFFLVQPNLLLFLFVVLMSDGVYIRLDVTDVRRLFIRFARFMGSVYPGCLFASFNLNHFHLLFKHKTSLAVCWTWRVPEIQSVVSHILTRLFALEQIVCEWFTSVGVGDLVLYWLVCFYRDPCLSLTGTSQKREREELWCQSLVSYGYSLFVSISRAWQSLPPPQ